MMGFKDIWDIDTTNELKNRTWWWWWWLFFFRNEMNLNQPKQLMILWGIRNCETVNINDLIWRREEGIERRGNEIRFDGLTSSWYYDGEKMHEPLFIDSGRIISNWADNSGKLSLKSQGEYEFSGMHPNYHIHVKNPAVQIKLDICQWTEELAKVVPTGKRYFKHLGYKMQKIRGSKVRGCISTSSKSEEVEGTAYFQKVRINSPTSPWYWGIFHTENGSYIDYFIPHIGMPMLRRSKSHKSIFDFCEKILSKGFDFYDAEMNQLYKIHNIRMTRAYENDLPIFTLQGKEEDKEIRMVMKAYSRACWRVEQPLLKIFNTKLFYNEYPATIIDFIFKDKSRIVSLKNLGYIVGNCEHSWGIV